jgi:hypothetical protein
LGASNDTLEDLGQIERNDIPIGLIEELSKKLSSNKSMKGSLKKDTVEEEESASTFKVLKAVDFAGTMLKSQANFRMWNI